MNEDNSTYQKAVKYTSQFNTQIKPEGFSTYVSASQAETVIIRQNNTIIAILLEINERLDKLLKGKTAEQPQQSGIEELITKLNNIEITPKTEKVKISRKPQKWTFFQLGEEKILETSKTKDQDLTTQKTN